MAAIHYKKTFVTGEFAGTTIDVEYWPLPLGDDHYTHEKQLLERYTQDKFFITDVKIVT